MPDVRKWLASLDLDEYADAFEQNSIDWEVLSELDHEVLKDIGVSAAGHRLRILKAAKALYSDALPLDSAAPVPMKDPAAGVEAERRQLTVMFCDLVDSTARSRRLDPEDLREVISECQDAWKTAITRYEGYIARYMGDGILVYFGYPQAHEDDAERAVRAALNVLERTGRLKAWARTRDASPFQVRLGIATGPVVVGDLIGEGASQESAAIGETPNLAARLQTLARPDTIVIDANTRALIDDYFACAELGERDLKGFEKPISVWSVEREKIGSSRFESRSGGALTTYVGRQDELSTMTHRWARATEGEGQLVLVSGEPGIGKSRMTLALEELVGEEPHLQLLYQCSPHHKNSAFYPVAAQLERAANIAATDSTQNKLDKLETLLAIGAGDSAIVVPMIAELLSIPWADRYPPLHLTPQRQKERTMAALVDHLAVLAGTRPVLMVFEDLHWIDPTTEELLDITVEAIHEIPVLLLATYRPEYTARWVGQAGVTLLTLNRLSHRESSEMVRAVPGARALSDAAASAIVDKADGIPLFAEELTKNAIEAGESDTAAVPVSLHASLLARLDRLGASKDIVQLGAVIGRQFDYRLLAAVANQEDANLISHLQRIASSGLIQERGTPPDSTYVFMHALIQDAAYESLLRSHRRRHHADIAQILQGRSPDIASTHPEILAWHLQEAALFEEAIDYWLRAGQLAARRASHLEAIAHLEHGLSQLERIDHETRRLGLELGLRVALGRSLFATQGYTAPAAISAFERAREISHTVPDYANRLGALFGIYVAKNWSNENDDALEIARELLRTAEDGGHDLGRIGAHLTLGNALTILGRPSSAREHLTASVGIYDASAHANQLVEIFGLDLGLGAYSHLAWASWLVGRVEEARQAASGAIQAAEEFKHPYTLARVYCWTAAPRVAGAGLDSRDTTRSSGERNRRPARLSLDRGAGRPQLRHRSVRK